MRLETRAVFDNPIKEEEVNRLITQSKTCLHYWICTALADTTVRQVCRNCGEVKVVRPKFNKGDDRKSALTDGCFDFALSHNDIRVKDYEKRGRSRK
jgi:hypothetical protein